MVKILCSISFSFLLSRWGQRGNDLNISGLTELGKGLQTARVSLEKLSLADNFLDDACAQVLADVLPRTAIHTIMLSGNQIGDEGMAALAGALHNTKIKFFDIMYGPSSPKKNKLGQKFQGKIKKFKDARKINPEFAFHPLLAFSSHRNNKITQNGLKQLAKALKEGNTPVRTLLVG